MFKYDHEWTELDWRHEADARDLAALDADRRDMQEYPAPPLQMPLPFTPPSEKCCDNPANFTFSPAFGFESETGYPLESFYRCTCGNLICEEDFAVICEWYERLKAAAPAPVKKEAA